MVVRRHRGFTLIELLVTATIAIILLLLATPLYGVWVADNEVRNGAESVASGLRYAQGAAISHNANAQFVMGGAGWNVTMVDTPLVVLQTGSFTEGSADRATYVAVDATSVPATTVAFNALGQVIPNATNLARVDVSMSTGSRVWRVLVGAGRTGVKLCDPDPKWVFPDPIACPP